MISVEIGKNEQNQRLDKFLRKYLENAPLSFIYKAIRKDVKVNGKRGREDTVLVQGDIVSLYICDEDLEKFRKRRPSCRVRRQFQIAYEDENILAAVKPSGLLTHGDSREKKNHLANQVVDYLIEEGKYNPRTEKTFTPAPVNRLDRNTTGLVLFGKNNPSLQILNRMIREKNMVRKFYLTVVCGHMRTPLHLRSRMVKDEETNRITVLPEETEGSDGCRNRFEKNISGKEKEMETMARPLAFGSYKGRKYTLAEVEIITGRTHQIRAHLAKAGFPVMGDAKYGNRKENQATRRDFGISSQLLHACRLVFLEGMGELSYLTGLEIQAELPAGFERIKKEIFEQDE